MYRILLMRTMFLNESFSLSRIVVSPSSDIQLRWPSFLMRGKAKVFPSLFAFFFLHILRKLLLGGVKRKLARSRCIKKVEKCRVHSTCEFCFVSQVNVFRQTFCFHLFEIISRHWVMKHRFNYCGYVGHF